MPIHVRHTALLIGLVLVGWAVGTLLSSSREHMSWGRPFPRVFAQSGTALTGWAWADMPDGSDQNKTASLSSGRGGGWISFSCQNENVCATSNYGVVMNSGGQLSGQAWSEAVGWISFDNTDTNGCPNAPCSPSVNQNNGTVTGWARAIAATGAQTGGWDGWIHLHGSNYGVNVSGNAWSGYAYGGDVLGWIHFQGPGYGVTGGSVRNISLSANPTILTNGGVTTVTWNTYGVTSCTGTNFSTGGALNGSTNITLSHTTTFGLACTGGGGPTLNANSLVTVNYPTLAVSLAAVPTIVQRNNTLSLNWSVSQVVANSCQITRQGGGFTQSLTNPSTGTGSVTSPAITGTTVFTLTCTGLDDSTPSSSVTVGVVPTFQEL